MLHFDRKKLADTKDRELLAKLEPIQKFAKTIKDHQHEALEAAERNQYNSIDSESQSD